MPKLLLITLILFIVQLLQPLQVSAQKKTDLMDIADNAYIDGDYYTAAKWYHNAMDMDSTDIALLFKYAEANRQYFNYTEAEKIYNQICNNDKTNQFPLSRFWLATMKKNNGNYTNAKKDFEMYYKQHATEDSYFTKTALHEINACETAAKLKKLPSVADIIHLDSSVNSVHTEFGAFQLGDTALVYSSLRPIKSIEDIPDGSPLGSFYPGTFLTKIYSSSKAEDTWMPSKEIAIKINNNKSHNANIVFTSNYKRIYFTRCDDQPNQGIVCSIYMMDQLNDKWQKPVALPATINIKGYTSSHPNITIDKNNNQFLYFTSNRPGGFGNLDIWYSTIKDSIFSNPINAGDKINTIGNEMSPFYDSKRQALFFSSDWLDGLGGYDIFKSYGQENNWKTPENIGFPINTSYNDLYFTVNKTDTNGYVTSNRPGSFYEKSITCCNDIYQYKWFKQDSIIVAIKEKPKPTPVVEPTPAPQQKTIVKPKLTNMPSITLYFANDEPNKQTTSTTTTIDYLSSYRQYINLQNEYLEKSENNTKLNKLFITTILPSEEKLNTFKQALIQHLQAGKTITIQIDGFCSPLTKSDYNTALSKRRINSFVNYIKLYETAVIQYINNGKLIIIENAFGEDKASKKVSADFNNQPKSVYSAEAALERKIVVRIVNK